MYQEILKEKLCLCTSVWRRYFSWESDLVNINPDPINLEPRAGQSKPGSGFGHREPGTDWIWTWIRIRFFWKVISRYEGSILPNRILTRSWRAGRTCRQRCPTGCSCSAPGPPYTVDNITFKPKCRMAKQNYKPTETQFFKEIASYLKISIIEINDFPLTIVLMGRWNYVFFYSRHLFTYKNNRKIKFLEFFWHRKI